MIKRLKKPALTQATTTLYTLVAAKVAAAIIITATVVRTERTFIRLRILYLEKQNNNKLLIKIKKIILLAFIV